MSPQEEVQVKLERVREFLQQKSLTGVVLSTQANFAWLTAGGDNHVAMCSENGVAHLVVTPTGQHCVTSNIEEQRITDEEIGQLGLFEVHSSPWHEDRTADTIRQLAGDRAGADVAGGTSEDVGAEFARLRWALLSNEVTRYRQVGREAGRILSEVAHEIEPGWQEHYIAALMAYKCLAVGLTPHVALVAVDERISSYRHPIPTDKALESCAMLVIGARRHGLSVSATRMVYFGTLPDELAAKHRAVCEIDTGLILGTRPGSLVANIFEAAMQAYYDAGHMEEWKLHHQGGATGYAPRDYKATPDSREKVRENQAFAWNPSITGTKSEDTVIAQSDWTEVISASPKWPVSKFGSEGVSIERPNILVR